MLFQMPNDDDIPANSAPAEVVAMLRTRASILGVDFDEVLDKAKIKNRTTRWRIKNDRASMSTSRDIEAILHDMERKRGQGAVELVAQMHEWCELGRKLAEYDREAFTTMLERARKICGGIDAKLSISHPLPSEQD